MKSKKANEIPKDDIVYPAEIIKDKDTGHEETIDEKLAKLKYEAKEMYLKAKEKANELAGEKK